jgi:predicted nucleotide-binding protein
MTHNVLVELLNRGVSIARTRSPLQRQKMWRKWNEALVSSTVPMPELKGVFRFTFDDFAEDLKTLRNAIVYGTDGSRSTRAKADSDSYSSKMRKRRRSKPKAAHISDKRRTVFVVHGRDHGIKDDIFAFLRALGLNPLEWTKATDFTKSASPYVLDIVDAAFASAQAVVVMLSPDDEARLRRGFVKAGDGLESRLRPQPRPNVLFEAGMALGRNPHRTVLIEIGRNMRPFSDIGGLHTIRPTSSVEWRNDLANRLKKAGCTVDTSGGGYLVVGRFQPMRYRRPKNAGDRHKYRRQLSKRLLALH